jgi:hypothetical protein
MHASHPSEPAHPDAELRSSPNRFRFSLRALFLVLAAEGIGIAVVQATSRTPLFIPRMVFCAPSFAVTFMLMETFGLQPEKFAEILITITNGLLYGFYTALALVLFDKWRFLLFAFAFHGACVLWALLVTNC